MGWPSLNIVIMAIGSQEEVVPLLEIGKLLKNIHGHRVRIATHQCFRSLVRNDAGLEFYSVKGDSAELLSYGLSKWKTKLVSFQRIRKMAMGLFEGFWGACIDSFDDLDAIEIGPKRSFVADAIIAMPACYAHEHCAERLGIPLHIMTTSSRTPTQEIPHSQAQFGKYGERSFINSISYHTAELMMGQLLGPLLNHLRVEYLGLEPVSTFWSASRFVRAHIPQTYLWSQSLFPRPSDWDQKVDLAGFVPDRASMTEPSLAIANFLNAGEPPIYVGFGSMPLPDRGGKLASLIFDAIDKAGVRAIINTKWMESDLQTSPQAHILLVPETPDDWLFPRCSAVVHQGEPGMTAMGLKHGRPTVTIPFYGDQYFWGAKVASAKAGALAPIPYENLTADKLANAIRECLRHEAYLCAGELASNLRGSWNGAENAVASFHQNLPSYEGGYCIILPERLAVFQTRLLNVKLSALAAHILIMNGSIRLEDLDPCFQMQHPGLANPDTAWSSVMSYVVALTVQLTAAATLAGVAKLLVHAIEAPISFAFAVFVGLYCLTDLFHYVTSRSSGDKQRESTILRIRSWQPHMYGLIVRLLDGLASLLTQPYSGSMSFIQSGQGFSAGLLKSAAGFVFCGRTAAIAAVVLTVQTINAEMERWLTNKGKEDIVFKTRLRQGVQEFKGITADKTPEHVEEVTIDVCTKWNTLLNREERWQH